MFATLTAITACFQCPSLIYNQWQKVKNKYCNIVQINKSVEYFVDEVCKQAQLSCVHRFVKNSQAAYFKHLKSASPEDNALVLLDVAENYTQFSNPGCNSGVSLGQYSVKTASFCCLQKGQPDSSTRIFSNAVHAFLGKVLSLIKDSWSTLQTCIYFSDGASSQYKDYKNFANLCHHASDFQLAAKRDFFPLPHGKSLCNGIGGTVKHLVANAYLQSLK